MATVVLRSSTEQLLDDLERAVDDGVNTYKARNIHIFSASHDHEGLHIILHCHIAAYVEIPGVSTWRPCACMFVKLLMRSCASPQLVSYSLLSGDPMTVNGELLPLAAASCAMQ